MDAIDLAQHHDEQYRQQALQAHYARLDTFFDAAGTMRLTANSAPAIDGGGKNPESVECIDCGEDIDPARLRAKPDAVRCIDCQTKFERLYGKKS